MRLRRWRGERLYRVRHEAAGAGTGCEHSWPLSSSSAPGAPPSMLRSHEVSYVKPEASYMKRWHQQRYPGLRQVTFVNAGPGNCDLTRHQIA